MLEHMNEKRPPSQQLTDAMHIASKLIDGYQDFAALVVVDDSDIEVPMTDFVATHRRPPSLARVDGCTIPIHGVEAILAVSRLLADTDCLGGGFKNAGFVVRRNPSGMPLSVRAVKIDTGYSFNFDGKQNVYSRFFDDSPFSTGRKMKDQRDIQIGNCQTFEIEFEKLLPAQKKVFIQTLKHGLQRLDKKFIDELIWRDNMFNIDKVRVKREEVDKTTDQWAAYLLQLAKTYHKQLESVSTDMPVSRRRGGGFLASDAG